jgi:DNA-binding transcriptional ArsR family regulator
VDVPVNFLESGEVQAALDAIEAKAGRPTLVIVDTLARCFVGDENSTKDMGEFIQGIDTIKRKTEATVLVVHHTGKDSSREARGSSALLAAADTMIKASDGDMGLVFIKCKKQKDAEPFSEILLNRRTIDLGEGQSSCVMEASILGQTQKAPKENSKAKITLAKLGEKFGAEGATHGEWLQVCKDGLGISVKTFNRHLKELKDGGQVEKDGDGQGSRYSLVKAE